MIPSETWNTEPEIATDVSSQTRQNPLVDSYKSGGAHHEAMGQVSAGVWNGTDRILLSKPEPLVGYPVSGGCSLHK